jgi:hypothetical protein
MELKELFHFKIYQIELNSFSDVQTRSFASFGPVNVAQGAKAKLKKKSDFCLKHKKFFGGIKF